MATRWVGLFALAVWRAGLFSADAVVDANSRANTNAPPDGSPWDNVGTVNGLSGVYLANGWVLTAAHVGFGTFTLGASSFAYDGNFHQLTNSDGSVTDALMFHLATPPGVPNVAVVSNSPSPGAAIDMIGFGYFSGSSQMSFGSNTGFLWSAAPAKSWGNNTVVANRVPVSDVVGKITALYTDFSGPGSAQASNEGQAATGDSGGGVFQLTGSGWQLAGIMVGISQAQASAAVYGDLTFAVDVAAYRNQVIAVLASTAPVLSLTRSGGNVRACWADTGVAFNLQQAATLTNVIWTTVPQAQVPTNGQICVTIPATNAAGFFRLHK
jgi:hypothetical protein